MSSSRWPARRGPTRPRAAGGVFALSTFGNVGGALLTTFVLLRFLGTTAATIALVAALCLAALAAHRRSFPALALLVAALFPALDLWIEATEYVERNAYADYRIVELDGGGRMLDVSGQAASRHDAAGRGWAYAERVEKTLCEAGETRVLVLGAAGMTLGRGAPCALDVAFVDIDPAQARIAGIFLQATPSTSGTFSAADARAFLRSDPGGWPAIVVDTYSNPRTLPQHLLTVEFYRLARARLAAGGSLYVNHLAWPMTSCSGRGRSGRCGPCSPTARRGPSESRKGAAGTPPARSLAMCSSGAGRAHTTATARSIPTRFRERTWTAPCDDRRVAVPDPPLRHQRAHRAELGVASQPPHPCHIVPRGYRVRRSSGSGRNLHRREAQEHTELGSQGTHGPRAGGQGGSCGCERPRDEPGTLVT